MMYLLETTGEVYQGHFGEFTIDREDRLGVVVYRAALLIAALSFAGGAIVVLGWGDRPEVVQGLTPLFACFCLALGVSLVTIHIYMAGLHRMLQGAWLLGCAASIWVAWQTPQPLAMAVYGQRWPLVGVGLIFVALTGIYFKEAFCFNRLEAKLLTPLVPLLLLGHWLGLLPQTAERWLLGLWGVLFLVFALRKLVQAIPDDIGDKSVFAYLHQHS